MRVFFDMETSLRGRSGGHTGTAPTVSFGQIGCGTVDGVWVDCAWTVGFVWVDCAWNGWFRLDELRMGRLISFGWIARGEGVCLLGKRCT